VTADDRAPIGPAVLPAVRHNPTRVAALLEAHVGPTKRHPKADVVLWLCPPCAQEVSDPGHHQPPEKGRQR
jgi:hypothetical protein